VIAHDWRREIKCLPCLDGIHPNIRHDWANALDIEIAAASHQLNPAGQECACPCARGTND
jgi:hypothetical protein